MSHSHGLQPSGYLVNRAEDRSPNIRAILKIKNDVGARFVYDALHSKGDRAIYSVDITRLRETCRSIHDWWRISLADLDRISLAQLDRRSEGQWIRLGYERAIIARTKFGAKAETLAEEFSALSRDARRILAGRTSDSPLQAAVFYHVRFENIHPLHDGNGRTGRTILTGQLYQAYGYPPAFFEREIVKRRAEYSAAFKSSDSRETYRQLLILLSQIIRVPVATLDLAPQYSLEPLHRSEGKPVNNATDKLPPILG